MATVKMMQGDSYAVPFSLKINGEPLTPDMISEVEVYVGEVLRKTYSSSEVLFDGESEEWYFRPSQRETLSMEPDSYEAQARVKFRNGEYSDVKGINIGQIIILDAKSEEVI